MNISDVIVEQDFISECKELTAFNCEFKYVIKGRFDKMYLEECDNIDEQIRYATNELKIKKSKFKYLPIVDNLTLSTININTCIDKFVHVIFSNCAGYVKIGSAMSVSIHNCPELTIDIDECDYIYIENATKLNFHTVKKLVINNCPLKFDIAVPKLVIINSNYNGKISATSVKLIECPDFNSEITADHVEISKCDNFNNVITANYVRITDCAKFNKSVNVYHAEIKNCKEFNNCIIAKIAELENIKPEVIDVSQYIKLINVKYDNTIACDIICTNDKHTYVCKTLLKC